MTAQKIQKRLRQFASKKKAKILQGFFKTGPGEYGEGDIFLGVVVPDIRRVAKEFHDAPLDEITMLLASSVHEERLLALFMLVHAYSKGDDSRKGKIFRLYLKSTKYINNWDLVDLSAPNIVGAYLLDKSRRPLYALARSRNLWKRRMAILATFPFIKRNDFDDTLGIAKILLKDDHDLMHKAVGWMLREVGKREVTAEENFLRRHYHKMPRTMLRYAIERFSEGKRRQYLEGGV
jgi:3-methyladenine DNA glycosylase AlkD